MGRASVKLLGLLVLAAVSCGFFTPFAFFGGTAPAVVTYVTQVPDTSNASVYSFAGASTGTAAADRYTVVVAFGGRTNATTITGITLDNGGGASAMTQVVQQSNGNNTVGMFIIANPTGTTATIAVTFSAAKAHASIAIWSLTSLQSSTPVDSDNSTADPGSITLTTQGGGVAIGGAATLTTTSYTWTNLSERYDAQIESQDTYSGADASTAGSSLAITADQAADTNGVFIAASWR